MGRGCPRAWWLAVWLLLSAPMGFAGEEPCLKLAFGSYCLGGDVNALVARSSVQPVFRQNQGERLALVFQEGPERIYVLAFRNRIYKVLRRYRAATQLRFDDLYVLIRGTYGDGQDRSRFPGYATTSSRRLSSIRRGDGQAFHYWKASDAWHIELTWTRELGLALAYVATALDQQQQAAAAGGL